MTFIDEKYQYIKREIFTFIVFTKSPRSLTVIALVMPAKQIGGHGLNITKGL